MALLAEVLTRRRELAAQQIEFHRVDVFGHRDKGHRADIRQAPRSTRYCVAVGHTWPLGLLRRPTASSACVAL